MEEILDCQTVKVGNVLARNPLGLYDLTIIDEAGRIVLTEKNISFLRAISVIEEQENRRRAG